MPTFLAFYLTLELCIDSMSLAIYKVTRTLLHLFPGPAASAATAVVLTASSPFSQSP